MKRLSSISLGIGLLAAASSALAHTGHALGLSSGLAHPFTGLDHLLAMLAVGLWATQTGATRGVRTVWVLPLAFMTALTAGAAWALVAQFPLPATETAVAGSVLALGLCIALAVRMPPAISIVLTALFGLAHGHAHGSELPAAASPAYYAAGFLLATAFLHLSGIGLGIALRRGPALRALGAGIAAVGAGLLAFA